MKHKARLKWISRSIRRVNLISGLGKRFSNWQKQCPGQRGPIADCVPLSFAWWMFKTSKTNGLLAGVLFPPSSQAPRVSLAPKTPFPFPFKHLPRRLCLQSLIFFSPRRVSPVIFVLSRFACSTVPEETPKTPSSLPCNSVW